MPYGRLWPAHPHPLPDELLTSWIVRVAEANAIKLQTLSWQLFGNGRSPWNRDVDRSAPPWLLHTLCEHTGCNYWDAFCTTLVTYRGRLYPRRRASGKLSWVLPVKSYGMRHTAFGQQFCPACLASDAKPYFRKQWRLALYTYCPEHQCELLDECPNCHSPIMLYRGDFGRELKDALPMHVCAVCGTDLSSAPCRPASFPHETLRTFYTAALRSVSSPVSSGDRFDLGFFRVLHHFCYVMCSRRNCPLLLRHLMARTEQTHEPQLPEGRIGIEDLRRRSRHQLLIGALWLMEKLEERLREAWQSRAIRYNVMLVGLQHPPKWYSDTVTQFSNWRRVPRAPPTLSI